MNDFNNIWLDVEKVQSAMVKFYDMKVKQCNGMLVFVLKIDEA